jgi:ABC-type branched-subunit amino acid transport system permease subunit
MDYVYTLIVLALVYGVAATAENIAVGYSGQFSAAQGAVFGVGAYVYAFTTNGGWPLALALVVVAVAGGALGGALSYIGNRVRGDYFMVVTLAFQLVLVDVGRNLRGVTGGNEGMGGLRAITLGFLAPQTQAQWALLAAVVAVVLVVVYTAIGSSQLGLICKGIREDESATASIGRSPTLYKVIAGALSAAGTAFAGAVYGSYISYVSPSQFTVSFSIMIISALIIGGMGNPFGPLIGMAFLVGVPELLRFVPDLPPDVKARLLQVIYAGFLLLFLALRPEGMLPERVLRRVRLPRRRPEPAPQSEVAA